METSIYAYMTAEICSVVCFYTTKKENLRLKLSRKYYKLGGQVFVSTNGASDSWRKMFKDGRTVVGDKVLKVVLQQCDLEKLSSLCAICRKRIDVSLDIFLSLFFHIFSKMGRGWFETPKTAHFVRHYPSAYDLHSPVMESEIRVNNSITRSPFVQMCLKWRVEKAEGVPESKKIYVSEAFTKTPH